jgi:hypothetical protein
LASFIILIHKILTFNSERNLFDSNRYRNGNAIDAFEFRVRSI